MLRCLSLGLLASAISLAALPAFADNDFEFFTTPSKNIWCVIKRQDLPTKYIPLSVECDVANHAWKEWIQGDHDGSHGNRFMIPGNGPAEAIGSSDTLVGSAGPVLQYGSKLTFGVRPEEVKIICISEKIGLTCTNTSGGLLHLNREFYVLNKPVPR